MQSSLTTQLMFDFNIIRLIGNSLRASRCNITMDIEFTAGVTLDEQQENIAMVRYWIDNVLDNCIAHDIASPLDIEMFSSLKNYVMFCPTEPHDYLLLLLVIAKISAIGSGGFVIRNSTISSDTSQGFASTLTGNPLEMLPSPEEWMGEVRYFEEPWWNRPDGSILDIMVTEGSDPSILPNILINISTENHLLNTTDNQKRARRESKPAEIIKPNFRPTIIGKD